MEAGPSRPRRHTAAQAMLLFETIETDPESSDGSSLSLSSDEDEPVIPTNDASSSESDQEDIAPPPKRRNVAAVAAADTPVWVEIPEGEAETSNNFRFMPPNEPGVQGDHLTDQTTPMEAFRTLFTVQVEQFLLTSINEYAQHRCTVNTPARRCSIFRDWQPVTVSELYKFIAVIIQLGIDKPVSIRLCFASADSPSYKPWYHKMFARPRFEAIYHSMLHCAQTAEALSKDKIEPFINMLLVNFRSAFYPFQNLSLDEMVVGFQGRWMYKMFNPQKPKKYHIKVFGLTDSATGYVLNLLTYFGQNTSYDPAAAQDDGQAVKVFETLLEPFVKGHHIFADRYYTTMKLLEALSAKGFYYTGTVNRNRRGFPPAVKTDKIAHRQRKWFLTTHKGADIMCVLWRDKKARKPVIACSTKSSSEMVVQVPRRRRATPVEKPALIHDYNQNMNGCDRADQQTGYYGVFNRKTVKWWKKLFYFMFEICITNSQILHTLSRGEKVRLLDFKQKLVKEFTQLAVTSRTDVDRARDEARQPGRPSTTIVERFVGNSHLISHSKQDRACAFCNTGRVGTKKRTNFFCRGCTTKPHLHAKECFERFHTEAFLQ